MKNRTQIVLNKQNDKAKYSHTLSSVKMEQPPKVMHREMEHLSTDMERQHQEQVQVQRRRAKVQELCSKGYSQREISQVLQVGLATVNIDI